MGGARSIFIERKVNVSIYWENSKEAKGKPT